MSNLTKSDIDGLVDGIPQMQGDVTLDWEGCTSYVPAEDMRHILYLAAGLTAEGERKPERVRGWLVDFTNDDLAAYPGLVLFRGDPGSMIARPATPGWFVPDGAEP